MSTPLIAPAMAPASNPAETAIHHEWVHAASFHQSGMNGIGCSSSTMVTQNAWLASIAGRRLVPPVGIASISWTLGLASVRLLGWAVIAASRRPDGAGDEAGHLLGRALLDRLVGDL